MKRRLGFYVSTPETRARGRSLRAALAIYGAVICLSFIAWLVLR